MPRKKTIEEDTPTVTIIEEVTEDSDVEAILDQVGAASKYVGIRRHNPTTKELDYVARYDLPIDNLLDRVKDDHGGGKYIGRICGPGGAYLKSITFSIDSRFRPAPIAPPPVVGVATATPPSESLSEVKDLLKQLIALQMRPTHDPFDVFIKAAEIFKKDTPPYVAPVPSGPVSFSEMFSIFKQGMELGAQASGGEGIGYLPVIEKMGLPLIEAIKTLANKPNPTVEKSTNGVKNMPTPIPSSPEQYLTSYLPRILALAAAKKDPSLYADLVLDQTPESAHGFLVETASRPDVIAYLTSLHPGVKEHEAWFLEFTKALRESFEIETAEEELPAAFGDVPFIPTQEDNE